MATHHNAIDIFFMKNDEYWRFTSRIDAYSERRFFAFYVYIYIYIRILQKRKCFRGGHFWSQTRQNKGVRKRYRGRFSPLKRNVFEHGAFWKASQTDPAGGWTHAGLANGLRSCREMRQTFNLVRFWTK